MGLIRVVLAAVGVTLATVTLLLNLFLNSVLGVFGLAATSIDKLQQLSQSQRVVEKMQARHADKKNKLSKRHTKRAGRRIASTALAAATIGTAAVAVTVASIEVDDYCDARRSLQEEANILYGSTVVFDLQQCVDEGLQETEAILREVKKAASQSVLDALDSGTNYSAEAWKVVRQQVLDALQLAGDAAASIWDAMQLKFASG